MSLNEADTCRIYVTPALQAAQWGNPRWRIAEQHYFTDGQIYLVGAGHQRRKGKKADFLLRYEEGFPIAVVEAKDEEHDKAAGLQQAKEYAQILGLSFAYSTNGHGIVEWDFTNNTQADRDAYPTPDELWKRLCDYQELEVNRPQNPLLMPYDTTGGKKPRYYQEVAINRAITAMLQGQKRVLLNLATGTGKTVIAFQTAWKLWSAKWNVSGQDRHPRILFLADRNILRDQAYNTFAPFENEREIIEGGQFLVNRTVNFAIYQAMFAGEDGNRLYQKYPPDFFDLIIIDECHRSGFGTWGDILKHFNGAVHLGMTATPKTTESVNTFKYFGEPVFTYSLGQGIDDGFLATYKVHRVITNYTQDGLIITDEEERGATLEVPAETPVQEQYNLADFERKITMPDHVHHLCEHLAGVLQNYGRMEKTMVFCVNQDHALQVTTELNRLNRDLNVSDYAVRIVSEEGAVGKGLLEKFQNAESPTPVVATTVDLLTTGVDAPSVRNVVFMKPLSSPISFKQIIGRGSRLCPDTDKFWFRIVDYTNSTRLFDQWDVPGEPGGGGAETCEPFTCIVIGKVVDEETGLPIAGAHVVIQTNTNEVIDQHTGPDGQFVFTEIGTGQIVVVVTSLDRKPVQMTRETRADVPLPLDVRLSPKDTRKGQRVKITGIDVQLVDESYEERDAEGKLVSPEDYLAKVRDEVLQLAPSLPALEEIWIDRNTREKFLESLDDRMIQVDILREILKRADADSFDLLASVAFDEEIHSCEERAAALINLHQSFFQRFSEPAQEVLKILVEKYRYAGLLEVSDPRIFTLAPFNSDVREIAKRFGGLDELRVTLNQLVALIYGRELK